MKKFLSIMILSLFVCSSAYAERISLGDGRKVVTTAGTSVALVSTKTFFHHLDVCAETDNTGVIVTGFNPIASLSTREGIPLMAGDCRSYDLPTNTTPGDLQDVSIDATDNGDGVTFEYWRYVR